MEDLHKVIEAILNFMKSMAEKAKDSVTLNRGMGDFRGKTEGF